MDGQPSSSSCPEQKPLRFEGDLSALYHEFDGTGLNLKVDWFERRTCDLKGAVLGQVIHYSVYVEGLPECSMEFNIEWWRDLTYFDSYCAECQAECGSSSRTSTGSVT